jgi:crotonobetainyl-CoA:carnitine CoA-transferase CaiB-like acyl-CoA transferase
VRVGGRRAAPQQGQHTDEILAEYDYSTADIAALRAKKVVV